MNKKIIIAGLIACSLLTVGCNKPFKSDEEARVTLYHFNGEIEVFETTKFIRCGDSEIHIITKDGQELYYAGEYKIERID